MNYVFMSVEFIYICRMKPIIKKILAGPLWVSEYFNFVYL